MHHWKVESWNISRQTAFYSEFISATFCFSFQIKEPQIVWLWVHGRKHHLYNFTLPWTWVFWVAFDTCRLEDIYFYWGERYQPCPVLHSCIIAPGDRRVLGAGTLPGRRDVIAGVPLTGEKTMNPKSWSLKLMAFFWKQDVRQVHEIGGAPCFETHHA